MKRVFEIEYPDSLIFDTHHLLIILMASYHKTEFGIEDVTDKMRSLESHVPVGTRYVNADFSESPVSAGCRLEE
jgi:hypothetical protein